MSTLPLDPFGRSMIPAGLTREDRVRLLGEAFEALLAGEMPSPEGAQLLGSGGMDWLESGGHLEQHLRVVKAQSHFTPARLWAMLRGNRGSCPMSARNETSVHDPTTQEIPPVSSTTSKEKA